MGLRLQSEFKSSNDKQYKIELYQVGFTGAVTSFNLAEDGFSLEYSGETDDIVSPIVSSSCTIQAYNNSNEFDQYIDKLMKRQDETFFMKVLLHDGSSYQNYWSGVILQDLVTELDESKPRIFEIVASDGIGYLANKLYEYADDVTIESFIESTVNALDFGEMYTSTDPFYATTLNVWDIEMTYDAAVDPSTLIKFDASVYASREEDGTRIYTNHLEILRELCVAFGARFYQNEGVFHFEQYLERDNASRSVTTYQFDGTKISTASVSDDVTLDQTTSGGARMSGNVFNFLPALQKVQVSFDSDRAYNLLASMIHFEDTTTRKSVGFIPNQNDGRIQIDLTLQYQLTLNTTPPVVAEEFYRPVWEIEVRVEDVNNPGTFYYLNRDWTPGTIGAQLYGPTTWTTNSSSRYHVDAGMSRNAATGLYMTGPTSIVTPPFPVSGNCEIDINFQGAYDRTNALNTPQTYFNITREQIARKVMYIDSTGGATSTQVFSSTNNDTRINSNLTLDLGNLRVNDAAGVAGTFFIYDGSNWIQSTLWRRGNSGSHISLFKLLTSEVLSLHKAVIERFDGTIISSTLFNQRFIFESENWVMLRGTYNANLDQWTGEWFAIKTDSSNTTIDDPIGSGGVSAEFARTTSQQGTDEVINAVQVNTTTSDVAGDQTVGGVSTLQETSVQAFTMNSKVSVAINDVTAGSGGSENQSINNHMNFITYAGDENGTYTINLPNSQEGVELRFKTDSTISATKKVHLSPATGETIDGATEPYQMDRSFDGITLMGHNGDWFITQKKEK